MSVQGFNTFFAREEHTKMSGKMDRTEQLSRVAVHVVREAEGKGWDNSTLQTMLNHTMQNVKAQRDKLDTVDNINELVGFAWSEGEKIARDLARTGSKRFLPILQDVDGGVYRIMYYAEHKPGKFLQIYMQCLTSGEEWNLAEPAVGYSKASGGYVDIPFPLKALR